MAGGRIVGALVVELLDYDGFAVVQELHSTKGWKPSYRVPVGRRFGWIPKVGDFSWREGCGPNKDPEVRRIPGETPLTRARHHHPRSKRDMAIAKAKREYTEGLYGQLR